MSGTMSNPVRIGKVTARAPTMDTLQNVALRLGYGTENLSSASTYAFNFITRNRQLLEAMYRGSWIIGRCIDTVAEDMFRAGIALMGAVPQNEADEVLNDIRDQGVYNDLQEACKWGRLYGGAIGVMLIEGQDFGSPLRPETIRRDQFKGIYVYDRWQLDTSVRELVTEFGPELGMPMWYQPLLLPGVLNMGPIHYTRVVRFDGVKLPYQQRSMENLWSMSIIERLFDRLVAYDSATQGAAQLTYKAHLRTVQVEGLRELYGTAGNGAALTGFLQQMEMIRLMQNNEGLTILDAADKYAAHSYTFTGLPEVILQFAQQISGASDIPLVRLFGQSPAGLNATGAADIRNYYDRISRDQNTHLRRPMLRLARVAYQSKMGKQPPKDFEIMFNTLWQLTDQEKAEVGERVGKTVGDLFERGVIGHKTALQELRGASKVTGLFSNITQEQIDGAEEDPPDFTDLMPGAGDNAPGGKKNIPGVSSNPRDRLKIAASQEK